MCFPYSKESNDFHLSGIQKVLFTFTSQISKLLVTNTAQVFWAYWSKKFMKNILILTKNIIYHQQLAAPYTSGITQAKVKNLWFVATSDIIHMTQYHRLSYYQLIAYLKESLEGRVFSTNNDYWGFHACVF